MQIFYILRLNIFKLDVLNNCLGLFWFLETRKNKFLLSLNCYWMPDNQKSITTLSLYFLIASLKANSKVKTRVHLNQFSLSYESLKDFGSVSETNLHFFSNYFSKVAVNSILRWSERSKKKINSFFFKLSRN